MKKAIVILVLLVLLVLYVQKYEYIDLSSYRSEFINVEIKGKVKNPDTYQLPYHSKVKDIIEKAGGILESGNTDSINMNKDLHNNDVIVINETINDEKISINSGTLEQLTTLNGIGPAVANKIINYRNQVGSFQAIEDIMNIKGIKDKLFAKIKDKICL